MQVSVAKLRLHRICSTSGVEHSSFNVAWMPINLGTVRPGGGVSRNLNQMIDHKDSVRSLKAVSVEAFSSQVSLPSGGGGVPAVTVVPQHDQLQCSCSVMASIKMLWLRTRGSLKLCVK